MNIMLVLCLMCGIDTNVDSHAMSNDELKHTVIAIQREVVDLTNPLELLNCKEFQATRKAMSKDTAERIVKLIEQQDLTDIQSEIGVLLLSSLREETYWNVTKPLVNTNTQKDVLKALLLPPMPYGPGYANAYKEDEYNKKLSGVRSDAKAGKEIQAIVELILSGKASIIYKDYQKHPDKYGY